MNIFDYNCYRTYLNDWIRSFPQNGRGLNRKISEVLNCNSSYVSQFLSGAKDLSLEHGMKLSKFIQLSELEEMYLMNLVSFDRAGEYQLKEFYAKEIDRLKVEGSRLKNKLNVEKSLSLTDSLKYYSDSTFSLVRLAFSIDSINTKEDILERLNIRESKLDLVIEFLLSTGLIELENNKYKLTSLKTHLGTDSGMLNFHHKNWRMRALDRVPYKTEKEMFYTGPMTIGSNDTVKVKDILEKALKEIYKVIEETDPDEMFCLNFDWFSVLNKEELDK